MSFIESHFGFIFALVLLMIPIDFITMEYIGTEEVPCIDDKGREFVDELCIKEVMNPFRHRDLSAEEVLELDWEGSYRIERQVQESLEVYER
jgi:hypothetical protein